MRSYKIYFGEVQILIISRNQVPFLSEKVRHLFIQDCDALKIINLIKENKLKKDVIIVSDDCKSAFNCFRDAFLYRKAAGGIVSNSEGNILFILKNGTWDLPKGNVDKNEKLKDTALREVSEECGVKDLWITKKTGVTYHIGRINEGLILKKTTWYNMQCFDPRNIDPEISEGITEVAWVNRSHLPGILLKSYRTIRELFTSVK
jgi:ADP-ribose pyrophosphatase YjhB (NUDIX family)